MKFVISSGNSIVSKLTDTECVCSKNVEDSVKFDSIGEAIRFAIEANNFCGGYHFKICEIESHSC